MTKSRPSIDVGPLRDEAESKAFTAIVKEALFFPDANLDEWLKREGPETARVARIDGRVVGGLTVQPLGQWFGGKVVSMGGVRAVGVAAECRAAGVASEFMRYAVREMRDNGVHISTLYPATQRVYRRAGYEKAGVRRKYKMRINMIDVRERELEIRRIDKDCRGHLEVLHRQRASRTAGNVERNKWLWDRILDPPPWSKPTAGFLVLRNGTPEGYFINHNTPGFNPHDNFIELQDFVAATPQAARRLWTLIADHRSMAGTVTWCGQPGDPLLFALDEQVFSIDDPIDWMVRINDVPGALSARGYPSCLNLELHLDVQDDVIPQNNGRFVLRVADGSGEVEKGGRGDLKIDVRGLAPLYTGHLSARELALTGYLDASGSKSDQVLDTATATFAGPAPWMSDMF